MKRVETEALVRSLIAIENDAGMAPFREWIDASLRETEQRMRTETDATQLRWLQGAAQELESMKQEVTSARETLKRMSR